MKKGLSLVFLCYGLSSCQDVDTKVNDGKVPDSYLEFAQMAEGLYKGDFNGREMTFSLELDADNKILFSVSNDLLPGCNSRVGDLNRIRSYFKPKAPRASDVSDVFYIATLDFDANQCLSDVLGKNLELVYRSGFYNKVELRIFKNEVETEMHCAPKTTCVTFRKKVYLTGTFKKL